MQLIIAEKPAVARDIARVLGVTGRGDGALRSAGHVITWCIGHLVELEEPAAYDPAWKRWSLATLPMIPVAFKLRPSKGTAAQWRVVRDLLRSREFDHVVNACDAGREGELIFRYCYELAGSRLAIRRLWISSLTDQALRAGLARLRPSAEFDPLADAARCRSEADWLVGMNATRAVTTRFRDASATLYSLGRVQTPTLALLVAREKAITGFVPRDYWEVSGRFDAPKGSFDALFTFQQKTRVGSREVAEQIAARASRATAEGSPGAEVESVEKKTQREPPPLLFDLTSLQRTANRRFGFSAQRTLDLAQALYERHKLITYPRTDSRHLSTDLRGELPAILRALAAQPSFAPFAAALLAAPPGPSPRVFNNARVSDHHAIIPTAKPPAARLDPDEARLHDLIVRRFLGAFYPDAEFALTHVVVRVGARRPPPPEEPAAADREALLDAAPPAPDRFHARGRVRLEAGWQEVAGFGDEPPEKAAGDEQGPLLPPLEPGERLSGRYAHAQKTTQPPRRYNEATLLSAMESAGKVIEDEALRLAMKECGLGTPATRASTIETLLKRGYLERRQKNLLPTALGCSLIDTLPAPSLASPELTGDWEARLSRMARGEGTREAFMRDIGRYVSEVVGEIRGSTAKPPASAAEAKSVGRCPACGGAVAEQFKFFACAGCAFRLWKVIAGKRVSPELAAVLLARGRTKVLPGFRSKAGKPFSAALELSEGGAVRLAFEDGRAPTPGAAEPAKAGAKPAASGGARRAAKASSRTRGEGRKAVRPAPRARAAPGTIRMKPAAPGPAAPGPDAAPARASDAVGLVCPLCGSGAIIAGRRAWGCARWREGCSLVVPFELGGRRLRAAQLRDLITQGHTRRAAWEGPGSSVKRRAVLDLSTEPPVVRLEPPLE